jgi:hypothetical protein
MTLRRRAALALIAAVTVVATAGCQPILVPIAAPSAPPSAVTLRPRLFAVGSDPWSVRTWAAQMGVMPSAVMEFESFDKDRTLDTHFAQALADGMHAFIVTWEPWTPVAASRGQAAQFKAQPGYSNQAIAAGKLDGYLTRFARSVAAAKGLTVYIRFGHEMNGDWYPWSHDPAGYVAAWRHVVTLFRAAGATNAKFVFSVNPSPYLPQKGWLANVMRYWPGASYVDQVGATMINFGGLKQKSVAQFAARLATLHATFHKNVMLAEVNTASQGRVRWLTDLRTWVSLTPWVTGVVWSQDSRSRGATQLGTKVGNLNWNVTDDPQTRPVVQALIHDLQHPAGLS